MAQIDRPLRRGQIYWVDWEPQRGSEQAGRRPALVIQANIPNELDDYNATIVAAISSDSDSERLRVKVEPSQMNGLSKKSIVKFEQIMTISKNRLDGYIGILEPRYIAQVDEALRDVLNL